MEIKFTIIITLLLCLLNSSFFVLYDEMKRGGVVSADGSESNFPIFYIDKDKELNVVDNRQVDETAVGSEEAPVVSQPVYKSNKKVSQNPATGGQGSSTPDSAPPQDPPSPPDDDGIDPPDPSGYDIGDDIGGPTG